MPLVTTIIELLVLLSICSYAARPLIRGIPIYSGFAKTVISIALGVLLGGLLYTLSIIAGINSTWLAASCLLGLAILGQTFISDNSTKSKEQYPVSLHPVIPIILFLPFGGLILITSIKMGLGDFPPFFVNMDTPLRLSQAFAMVQTETYPPESLMNSGTFHAYHYGGPASVAFISKITGILPHKIMFWVVNPLLLLAGFFSLLSLLGKTTATRLYFIFGFFLFLPFVFLGNESFFQLNSYSGLSTLIFNLIGGTTPGTYDSEAFARGIPGVATLSGLFLLFLSTLLLVTKSRNSVYATVLLVSVLIIFTKMDFAPAVFTILGIAVIRLGLYSSIKMSAIFLVILLISPLVYFNIFGYFSHSAETQLLSFRSVDDFLSHFDWKWNRARYYLREQLIIAGLFLPIAWLFFTRPKTTERIDSFLIGTTAFLLAVCIWILVASVNIPKVGGQFAGPMWIGIPLMGVALLYATKDRFQYLPLIIFLPFVVIGIQGQLMKFNHMVVAIVLPEHVNEYADNRLIGDALRHIPVNSEGWTYHDYVDRYPDLMAAYNESGGTLPKGAWGKNHFEQYGEKEGRRIMPENIRPLLVTNDFRYVSWPDSQPQIPGLFGHQTYGVHLRHFPGPRGFNREGERRILAQRTYLSRNLAISNPEFAKNTKKVAQERGWTHFLLRKDLDDELPSIDSNVIPLHKLYENERYAVFEF